MIYIIILILAVVCIISGKVNKPLDKHKRKKAPAAKAGAKHPQTDAAIDESLLFINDLLQDEKNPEKIYKLLQRKIKLLKAKEDLRK